MKIRHDSGYVTYYGHLSRFADGLRVGQPVGQKQVIGYVGSTGLSTGPHVCFRVAKDGKYVNPIQLPTPEGPPLPEQFNGSSRPIATPCSLHSTPARSSPPTRPSRSEIFRVALRPCPIWARCGLFGGARVSSLSDECTPPLRSASPRASKPRPDPWRARGGLRPEPRDGSRTGRRASRSGR